MSGGEGRGGGGAIYTLDRGYILYVCLLYVISHCMFIDSFHSFIHMSVSTLATCCVDIMTRWSP